jgi:Protein of unknown function (DUF3485)
MTPILAPLLAAALAGGLYAQMSSFRDTSDTTAFHAGVKAAVEGIPIRIGEWDGREARVPDAAVQLLKPNVLFARAYLESGDSTARPRPEGQEEPRRWAKLIVIHSRDSRDMSGHYPPNCYRGSGWLQEGPATVRQVAAWGRQVPIAEYEFTRTEMDHTLRWTIFDTFVLPAGGFVTDMDDVYRAVGDYRTRPYGAAQIQVIMDSKLSEPERLRTLDQMLAPLAPVIDRLQLPTQGARS